MPALTALSPTNFHKPCLCVLALDVSSSMAGTGIKELNDGLQEFYKEIYRSNEAAEKLEICIVTFGSEVKCIQEPAKVDDFKMPILEANGTTKLVEGISLAIKQVELRKEYYRKHSPQYSRPMILVMTDGEPDNDQNISDLHKQIINDMPSNKYTIHVLGTSDCNFNKVAQFCPKTLIYELKGLNYSRFFRWLTNTVLMSGLSNGESLTQFDGSGDFMEQATIN
jgi:uncharacterized protein YegL